MSPLIYSTARRKVSERERERHRKRENILVACICFFFIGAINTESLIKSYRT